MIQNSHHCNYKQWSCQYYKHTSYNGSILFGIVLFCNTGGCTSGPHSYVLHDWIINFHYLSIPYFLHKRAEMVILNMNVQGFWCQLLSVIFILQIQFIMLLDVARQYLRACLRKQEFLPCNIHTGTDGCKWTAEESLSRKWRAVWHCSHDK